MKRKASLRPLARELRVDMASKRPVYLQLMDGFRRLAYRSALDEGARLPTVRALAGQLDVNHNTVARAYRELDREGLLRSRVGKGTFMAKLGREHENKSLAARIQELEREMRNKCVQLGLSEKEFLSYVKGRSRKG